jgi:hypothetical protein
VAFAYRLPEDPVRSFVEEVLRTGLTLTDVLSSLLDDLPEDAFRGENPGEVLIEMVVGTMRPAADAAGERAVREATALVGALGERVLADLRRAAALAAQRERRGPAGERGGAGGERGGAGGERGGAGGERGGDGRERRRTGGGRGGAGRGRMPRR